MSFLKSAAFLIAFFTLFQINNAAAQQELAVKLSAGASIGYAPFITMGTSENNGIVSSFFGALQYGQLIGRLQYTSPLLATFDEDNNLDGGSSYHGSLGYILNIKEGLSLNMMLSGGAMVTTYNNGIFGSKGDTFTNVSPQVGVNLFPTYQITKNLAVQGGLRYYKGFEAGDRGRASDLMDLAVGLRFTL